MSDSSTPPRPAAPAPLDERARDYPRIAAALDFLSAHWRDQPDLAAAAAAAGLSPGHFQRVFTRWTGASPKRFVQALTHASARRLLVDGASVLDAALETGLSGPSRLHDVFIAEEAVTPGEAKAGGMGIAFRWGEALTPFGTGVFLIAPRGLSALAFAAPDSTGEAFADLAARGSSAMMVWQATGRGGFSMRAPGRRPCRWRSMARPGAARSGAPCCASRRAAR